MAGGLMNLVAYGNQNIILNGNPSKTFFKFVYSKYTNFGLQKFRIDMQGQRVLNLTQESKFSFKIPRYGDLLMDTYLVINMPNIWSPILQPNSDGDCSGQWLPYEFKWIKNLGSQIIKEVTFSVGGQIIQKFSGNYLQNMVERDFTGQKKALYYEMTGNTSDLNDPANYSNRNGYYPNAWYTGSPNGSEPSIRGKTLYIPMNIWFTLSSKMAFPLVSLQYNELHIDFTLRPVNELFVVRDITSLPDMPYIQANQNEPPFQFYRFIQQPPLYLLSGQTSDYDDKRTVWNSDIHLLSTYGFLSTDEVNVFALQPQSYLIKEVYEYSEDNIQGSKQFQFDSLGMVASWMFYLQRTDISVRNEWSNYSNWPYDKIPRGLHDADPQGNFNIQDCSAISPCCPNDISGTYINGIWYPPNQAVDMSGGYGPGTNPGQIYGGSGIKVTGIYTDENIETILQTFGLLCDGKYRENVLPARIYNTVEKYTRTNGYARDSGLYCYNFCLNTNPFELQPSGAMNLSKFNNIQFEIQTLYPPLDPLAQVTTICDGSGNVIGINKPVNGIFKYTYDFNILEERYNVLKFIGGNAALMYAR